MILIISDVQILLKLAASLSKFIESARFDFSQDGLRIRSIDSEDFCYLDILLKRPFFESIMDPSDLAILVDVSRLNAMIKVFSKQKRVSLIADPTGLRIMGDNESVQYEMASMAEDFLMEIPEPKSPRFNATATVSTAHFLDAIKGASAIAKELKLELTNGLMVILAKNKSHSYRAAITIEHESTSKSSKVEVQVLSKYLKAIEPLLKLSETVRLSTGSEMPVQVSLEYRHAALFSFSLAPRRTSRTSQISRQRRGDSLPRITASRFPNYMLYVSAFPEGLPITELKQAGIETAGNDYTRLATKLKFVEKVNAGLTLSDAGAQLAGLFKADREAAKDYLHGTLMRLVPAYRILIDFAADQHIEEEGLFEKASKLLLDKEGSSIDRQDFATLTGLATWCGRLDRRLGVIFSPSVT